MNGARPLRGVIARLRRIAFTTIIALMAGATWADEPFPQQPIRLVVAFHPATTIDNVARMVAEKLERSLGKPVIVDNRRGASGLVAEEIVARAKPDGHTLLVAGLALATMRALDGARSIHPLEAFAPVAWLTTQPVAIVAHPSLHVDMLSALLDKARQSPDALSFSTNGLGGPVHLAATPLFERDAGLRARDAPTRRRSSASKAPR